MTKTKIAVYVALIFLAGAFAGAFGSVPLRSLWKTGATPAPPLVRNREDFANHIFNRMKERLALTSDQVAKIEPVFRKGFEDVRAIQDRSVKEVEAAVKRNHEELSKLLTPEQRQKLEEWDREREKAMRERRGHRRGPGPGGPGGPGSPPPNGPAGAPSAKTNPASAELPAEKLPQ